MLNKFFNRNYLFREIYENNPKVNNLEFSVKLTRIVIRFFVINFNYDSSSFFLKCINSFLLYFRINKINNTAKYITYLFKINFLYIEFINNLKKLKIDTAFEVKKKLANHICDHSFSHQHRTDARQYLRVLDGKNIISKNLLRKTKFKNINEKFLILGPNANLNTLHKYKDHTLILFKPMNIARFNFKKKILFLNSAYFQSNIKNEIEYQNQLVSEFDKIYVSHRSSKLPSRFIKARYSVYGNLKGLYAINRLLENLIYEYGNISCNIEGIDFYTKSSLNNAFYDSLVKGTGKGFQEMVYCRGIAKHDVLYNFLYCKSLIRQINIQGSDDFLNLMSKNENEFVNLLIKNREFKYI